MNIELLRTQQAGTECTIPEKGKRKQPAEPVYYSQVHTEL